MTFEWDPAKSQANKAKHGIEFEEATGLWDDMRGIERRAPRAEEERFARIASCRGKLWHAVFTVRGGSIRIISVRRARKDEEDLYGQE